VSSSVKLDDAIVMIPKSSSPCTFFTCEVRGILMTETTAS